MVELRGHTVQFDHAKQFCFLESLDSFKWHQGRVEISLDLKELRKDSVIKELMCTLIVLV